MEKRKRCTVELKLTVFTIPSHKNGISYMHKLSVLWLSYSRNNSSYMISLN